MLEAPLSLLDFQRRFVQQALISDLQAPLYPYGQTMVYSQVSALAATFPGFVLWVGADCADALFERYIRDCPSDSADLNQRGEGFSQWLSVFIQDLPAYQPFGFLPDYVNYEWCCECLTGAPELQPSLGLEQISASNVARLRLNIQPSVKLLTSRWPLPLLIETLTASQAAATASESIQAADTLMGFVLCREQPLNSLLDAGAQLTLKTISLEEIIALEECLYEGMSIETAGSTLGVERFQAYLPKWLAEHWVYLIEA